MVCELVGCKWCWWVAVAVAVAVSQCVAVCCAFMCSVCEYVLVRGSERV